MICGEKSYRFLWSLFVELILDSHTHKLIY
jgi:hypothetical protein